MIEAFIWKHLIVIIWTAVTVYHWDLPHGF